MEISAGEKQAADDSLKHPVKMTRIIPETKRIFFIVFNFKFHAAVFSAGCLRSIIQLWKQRLRLPEKTTRPAIIFSDSPVCSSPSYLLFWFQHCLIGLEDKK
jgi:hypothetical protein